MAAIQFFADWSVMRRPERLFGGSFPRNRHIVKNNMRKILAHYVLRLRTMRDSNGNNQRYGDRDAWELRSVHVILHKIIRAIVTPEASRYGPLFITLRARLRCRWQRLRKGQAFMISHQHRRSPPRAMADTLNST